jgi:hypothetical protein
MKVSPMINSIAHMERAPLIFPIYSKHHSSKKTVPYAMDIGNPKFWEVFLGYIDEVLEVFGNTEYFAIGTDEFHRQVKLIEKACGKPCRKFYPEFVNRVNRYLRQRRIQTMIYHDMLGRRGLHGWPEETCNGVKDARKMLPKIDKDINILYWNYSCSRRFPFLKDLSDAGFKKLWVLPWFGEEPVEALLKKGYSIGAKVLITQWALTTHRNQFVHGSEFAWNIKNKSPKTTFDFNDLNDFLFYGRSTKEFVHNAESVTLSGAETPPEVFRGKLEKRFHGHKANAYGIPVDFSSMRSFGVSGGTSPEIHPPWNFKKMLEAGTLKDAYLYTDNSMQTLKLNKKTKVNEKRKSGDVVIYDSSYGKSTLNNNRGAEFTVDAQGEITRLSGNCHGRTCDETGNMEIPKDGYVISKSGGQAVFYYKQYDFYPGLREGDRLHVATLKKGAPVKDYISGKLNPSLRNVVIFINPRNVVKNGLLAQIKLYFVNGKTATFRLGSSFFFTGPCKFLDIPVWKRWIAWDMVRYGLRPVLALEWNSPKNYRDLKSIKIIPTQAGIDAGLTVLGVTQY